MKIDYLANYPALIPKIAEWCNSEWPWYYNNGDINAALEYHRRTAQRSSIPSALVALEANELVGTISIIEDDLEIRSELNPWLGCLFVDPEYRGRGVASALIKEGQFLAEQLKIPRIYAWTESLKGPLAKNGWQYLESTKYRGKQIYILSLNF